MNDKKLYQLPATQQPGGFGTDRIRQSARRAVRLSKLRDPQPASLLHRPTWGQNINLGRYS
jgi:hypothetical protein